MYAVAACLWLVALASICHCAPGEPLPVIVDTDLGQDMDDSWSIALLLNNPDVDVKLIVTASRCTTGKANLLAKFLTDIGRTDVPIGIGIPTAPAFTKFGDRWCNGTGTESDCSRGFFVGPAASYAEGFDLRSYTGLSFRDGVAAMADILHEHAEVTIVALGPFTNIASLLDRFPGATGRTHLLCMGGSIRVGWQGLPPAIPEYNIRTDAEASQRMIRSADLWASVTLAPLDTNFGLQLHGNDYQKFLEAVRTHTHPLAASVAAQYHSWYDNGCSKGVWCSPSIQPYSPSNSSTTLYDVQPAFMLTRGGWKSLQTSLLHVDVDSSGSVVEVQDTLSGGWINATLGWAEGGEAEFYKTVLDLIVGTTRPLVQI